jgi:hypothetical protein
MNNALKTITGGVIGVVLGAAAISYTTVGISSEAKEKVVKYSEANSLTQRDSVSKMVLEYPVTPVYTPSPNYIISWHPNRIKSNTVSIRILKKESDSPLSYSVGKMITSSTPNVGYFIWQKDGEYINSYFEIACGETSKDCESLPIIPIR